MCRVAFLLGLLLAGGAVASSLHNGQHQQVTSGAASATSSESAKLAAFVCPDDGNYAVPGECSGNYYRCIGGEAFLATCPGTDIFDETVGICVANGTAICQGATRPTTSTTTEATTSTSEPTTIIPFDCPEDGYFAIPGQCTAHYYICVNGTAYLEICPGITIFDPETLVCTSPETVSCFASTTTSPSTTTPSTTTPSTTTPSTTTPSTTTPSTTTPSTTTPSTTTPSTTTSSTTTPSTTLPTTITTSTSTGSTLPPFECLEDGNFAIPGQCSANYYVCVGGVAFMETCPGDGIFDPEVLMCLSPDLVSCTVSTTYSPTGTTTLSYGTTSGPFLCPDEDGNFPIPGQCTSDYYVCVGGVPYPSTCPGSAIFDPNMLICVNPENATCENTTTTPGSSTTATTPTGTTNTVSTTTSGTTGSPPSFVCPSPNGLFPNPDPTMCNTYYVCDNNNAILMYCNPPLVFNPQTLRCDWQYNVPDCKLYKDLSSA